MSKNITNSRIPFDLNSIGNVRISVTPTTNNNIVVFDGTEGNIKDSSVNIVDVVTSTEPTVVNNVVIYDDVLGNITDSGISINDVVTSTSPTVVNNIVIYDDVLGNVTDSGVSINDIAITGNTQSITFSSFPAGDNIVLNVKYYKVEDTVSLSVQGNISNKTSKAYYTANTPVIVGYRPSTVVYAPILCVTDVSQVDSDIMGTLLISTSGHISIYREHPPGSNTFNGANVGWGPLGVVYQV